MKKLICFIILISYTIATALTFSVWYIDTNGNITQGTSLMTRSQATEFYGKPCSPIILNTDQTPTETQIQNEKQNLINYLNLPVQNTQADTVVSDTQ
jgi:hypothetical protein